ncbi:guanylate kinase [Helicobacter sp. 13S00477-4]|uniref:guanylate kinase n=1 Tax=Helicobacter sp. 13S00477-4 TaxID=1905759 RepID=UPI0015D9E7C2|nr:guanylate kinase [Helicobacter sp. 13S00477-4]
MKHGGILILSGPSGAGKSTLCKHLQENIKNIYFSISTTTRRPRDGEEDGRHYYFVSKDDFVKGIKENKFLEWAQVHNNYYGTALTPIKKALEDEKLVIFDVDVQGHKQIKDYYKNARSVFVITKNRTILKDRLCLRQTDSEEVISLRLKHADEEVKYIDEFDYLLINDEIEAAKEIIICIAKTLPYTQNTENSKQFYQEWNQDFS